MARIWNEILGQWVFCLFAFVVLIECGGYSAFAADWFVRANGDDLALGSTKKEAWRTIDRVNRADLQPGDRVLFQGSQVFEGNLRLTTEDSGTPKAPITISSFGQGRAILFAGDGAGVTVENAECLVLENLILRGAGITNNTSHGILCDNTLRNGTLLEGLTVRSIEVSGFGKQGILVTGVSCGYRHVRIADCVVRGNLQGGVGVTGRLSWEKPGWAHADVEVSQCRVFDNPGDANYHKSHSGSGIVLNQVDGGLIDRCVAWNNGALNGSESGGPVGIWTCASRRVTIQHCESFGNRSIGADGGGFDIDGGCEECVLQYNYSHDNDGPGLMVYTYPYESRPSHDNVVRFNVSENDSRKGRVYAGLWIRNDGTGMTGVEVYNNTVMVGPSTEQAASIHGEGLEACFRNNIFLAVGGGIPLRVEKPHGKLRFENNLYWEDDSSVQIRWDQIVFKNLEEWREATGAELLDGISLGMFENPQLNVQTRGIGSSPKFDIANVNDFRPLPSSSVRSKGLNLQRRFGWDMALRDFGGRRLSATGNWPLGAFGK